MLHFNLLKAETAADAARLAADRFQEVICAKPACVGGKHHRGQSHRLQPHDRQHRQDHRQTAAAHAGQIMDAEDLFGFNRFYQIRNLLTLYGSNAGRMPPKGRTV